MPGPGTGAGAGTANINKRLGNSAAVDNSSAAFSVL